MDEAATGPVDLAEDQGQVLADFAEGIAAFGERRPPVFQGQ